MSLGAGGIVNMLNRLICTFTIIIENLVWKSTLVRKQSWLGLFNYKLIFFLKLVHVRSSHTRYFDFEWKDSQDMILEWTVFLHLICCLWFHSRLRGEFNKSLKFSGRIKRWLDRKYCTGAGRRNEGHFVLPNSLIIL